MISELNMDPYKLTKEKPEVIINFTTKYLRLIRNNYFVRHGNVTVVTFLRVTIIYTYILNIC